MRRKLFMAALMAATTLPVAPAFVPAPALAQTVYCTNCSDRFTQIRQQADQALQLVRQAEQLQVQLQSYDEMLRQGLALPDQVFGDVARDVQAINGLIEQAQGVAYTASNLDELFAERYGSFEGYRQAGVSDAQLQQKYRQWSDEANSSVLTTMRALGLQSQQMQGDAARLRQLQNRAGSAETSMQAVQVGNELAAETIAQMQQLRQLIMLQTNLQAQAMQLEADRDAVGAARAREFFQGSAPAYTGQTY